MEKIYKIQTGNSIKLLFWCHGCGTNHHFDPHTHKWNDDFFKPTVYTSILIDKPNRKCHSLIKDGKIIYLEETDHKLKGHEIDLSEFYH